MFRNEYEVRCEMTLKQSLEHDAYSKLPVQYLEGRSTLSKCVESNSIVIGVINFFLYDRWVTDDPQSFLKLTKEVGGNTGVIATAIDNRYASIDHLGDENHLDFFSRLIFMEKMELREEFRNIGLEKHFFEGFREFHDSNVLYLSVPEVKYSPLGFIYPENNTNIMLKDGNLI